MEQKPLQIDLKLVLDSLIKRVTIGKAENDRISRKRAIYKTRNTRTGNRLPRMRIQEKETEYRECTEFREFSPQFREISQYIPWNIIILIFHSSTDSREGLRGFLVMFKKTPENVQEDSGECLRRLWGMLQKTPGNAIELEVTVQFSIENHKWKISNIRKDFLNYTNFSCIVFYAKLSQNLISHTSYILPKLLTT